NPIHSRDTHGGKGKVGVGARIGGSKLKPLGLLAGGVHGNSDTGASVSRRVDQIDRRFVTGHQSSVGVGGRSDKGAKRMGVLDQTANVKARRVADEPVALLVVEDIFPALPQTLMAVHPGAVVLEQGLGHDGDHLASFSSGVLDYVLVGEHLVGHLGHGVKAHVDLGLAASGHFVVVHFDFDPALLQIEHHLGSQILVLIHGGNREIPFFVADLVAQIGDAVVAGVPKAFDGVDVVIAFVLVLIESHAVEDEKLDLGSPVASVGDAGRF